RSRPGTAGAAAGSKPVSEQARGAPAAALSNPETPVGPTGPAGVFICSSTLRRRMARAALALREIQGRVLARDGRGLSVPILDNSQANNAGAGTVMLRSVVV
ncbi:hypothetical protein, partial [uncultured Mesorhizobium sp.]|uniref:hypothetical protein n=1 Tax=uncultured Mesorhizobium sp. TaxID=233795 RepID=UPI0025989B1F